MKYIFILVSMVTLLFSDKALTQLPQKYFNEDFENIIRFDMLHFKEDRLDSQSQHSLEKILQKLHTLKKEGRAFEVTVIGHLYRADDYYPPKNKNSLNYLNEINKTVEDNSSAYAYKIRDILKKAGIEESKIVVRAKSGYHLANSDESTSSKVLSNRVMLTLYILKEKELDSDGDGIFDKYDRCKNTPQGVEVDKNGCPVDRDKDGVVDYKDICLGSPPVGITADADGCPLDSDEDGIVDYKDRCENTPLGLKVDIHGCPFKQTLKLFFQRGSAKIMPESYPAIQKFADFLKKNPAYKVKIIGHTDSRGKAEMNMRLSLARAEAVKQALVLEGIDATRIIPIGRGELDPIASNRTKEGRAKNRRIEIELY